MNHILVRYGEIGTKTGKARSRMQQVLRQRVADKLEHEEINFRKVSSQPGRIIVETETFEKAAEKLELVPGISSIYPALKTEADIEKIKQVTEKFEVGETFGVDANTVFTDIPSQEIKQEVGAYVDDEREASVDLDYPDTWIEVEVRDEDAYVSSEKIEGVGGLPAGVQGNYAALISGGIDSPVAAYQMMKRGADITPIYFYNKPIAAVDHLARFEEVIEKLKQYHPGKKWEYFVVDMEEVNEKLLEEVEKGRMVLHRKIMFRVAEMIAEDERLKGIVTGESLGQKSSQTAQNLEMTTRGIQKPLMRPLLTFNKNQITEKARRIGTFELAEINSACQTLSPENPATELKEDQLRQLEEKVEIDELVEKALENTEKKEL